MRRSTASALVLCALLVACVDTTGLSKESAKVPRGNANGILVEEFGDLQCPACQAAHTALNEPLLQKYGNQIRFEFKQFPLQSIHRYALQAALASECAADQGKFWEYVDTVYENQKELSARSLKGWAAMLALDTDLFNRCLDSEIKEDAVIADYEDGKDRGVSGTPTYFVNGVKVKTGLAEISAAIEAALAGAMQRL